MQNCETHLLYFTFQQTRAPNLLCVFIHSNFRLLFLFRYVCAQRETLFAQKYCLSSLLSFFLVLILDSFSLMKLAKCCCCLVTCWKNEKKEYVSLARQISSYRALFCLLPFPFSHYFLCESFVFYIFCTKCTIRFVVFALSPPFWIDNFYFSFFLETAQPLCALRWPDFAVFFY